MLLVTMQSHCQNVKVKSASTGNVSITKSWFKFQLSTVKSSKQHNDDCVWPISTFQHWSWTDCVSCQ